MAVEKKRKNEKGGIRHCLEERTLAEDSFRAQDFHSRRKHGRAFAEDETAGFGGCLSGTGRKERRGSSSYERPFARVTLPFTLYLSPRLPFFFIS